MQNALRDLNVAYQNFFRGVKSGKRVGFPKFKSKKHDRKSYATAANGNLIRLDGNAVVLPKLHRVEAKISRDIPCGHRIISATISQEPSGKYFVSVLTEYEYKPPNVPVRPDNALGLDYSSPHFYVDSDGNTADMPHFYRKAEKKLAREQRRLSKMAKGSNNYRKQKTKVARAYEKVRGSRKEWQHQESTRIADKYDMVAVEDINYQGMAKSLTLAKATNDNGFGQFREMLSYKLAERGKKLIMINKWFPSTKTCRFCGFVNPDVVLGVQEWDCPCCGKRLLRDHNAAINIRGEGLRNIS